MRTKTSIFDVSANGKRIKIVAGKKGEQEVELSVSPSRALSFYEVLVGRREGSGVRITERSSGNTFSLSVYSFRKKVKEGEEGEAKEIEIGKRIVLKRDDEAVLTLLLKEGGSLYLAEEIRRAIGEILDSGGYLELGGEDFYVLANASGLRVAYKSPPVFVPRKSALVLKTAVERGIALESKQVGWSGKTFTVRGKQLPARESSLLRSVIEVAV